MQQGELAVVSDAFVLQGLEHIERGASVDQGKLVLVVVEVLLRRLGEPDLDHVEQILDVPRLVHLHLRLCRLVIGKQRRLERDGDLDLTGVLARLRLELALRTTHHPLRLA